MRCICCDYYENLFFILNALSDLFGIGGGLISRMLGDGSPDEARSVCSFNFTVPCWCRLLGRVPVLHGAAGGLQLRREELQPDEGHCAQGEPQRHEVCAILYASVFECFASGCIRIFIDDTDAVAMGAVFLRINCLAPQLMTCGFHCSFALWHSLDSPALIC